jgi:hypothetical protein
MADNYLLVKGENGYTVKVKLKDLKDGTFALASNVATSALPTGAATELTLDEIKSYILSLLTQAATEDKQDVLIAKQTDLINTIANDILSAGKITDAATDTDKTIDPGAEFTTLMVINDGPGELRIAVDEDTLDEGSNVIYIREAEVFGDNIRGRVLHYSITNHSTTFRYVLR